MNSSRIKNEGWLYWLAFLIALAFRLIQLGAAPLTDSESQFALQALHIAQGNDTLLGPQPAYILFTSILFLVIESANFMARFIPAIVGSLIVFTPWYFRDKLKHRPALILALLFAVDPGLVALARQANGTILALTFLLFAWGMWRNGRIVPGGIFAGLALLSGPSIWSGLLMLGLTSIILRMTGSKLGQPLVPNLQLTSPENRPAIISLFATLLLGGTLFLTTPNGLSSLFSSLPAYLSGWTSLSVFSPGRMLTAFIGYEPLGIFLAVFALIRGYRIRSARITRLSIWLGVSLLLSVFYRQTSELVWVIVPLLILAAGELARSFDVYPEERMEIGLVAGAVIILLIYIWFNVSNIGLNPFEQINTTAIPVFGTVFELPFGARYVILFGAALILVVCVNLVAFGWSPRTARLGTTWSFSLFLGVYTLASAWGASGLRTPGGVELWRSDQPPVHADLLLSSVNDISRFSLGHVESQPVAVLGINSPALQWVLRNHDVKTISVLDPLDAPPIIITPLMNELGLPSAYRGQDFTWRQSPVWDNLRGQDWVKWLVYRQLPGENETIILWARDDLFPDAREKQQP
ncbi:MAG TPA: hypothetical protein DCX53_13920 [Anaerolineae bacterium]|nr:hypothetical protein [Anaerolineae bacterium]